jgi:hypothetical protein
MQYYCQYYNQQIHYCWDSSYDQADIDENLDSRFTTLELTEEQFNLARVGEGRVVSGSFEQIVTPDLTLQEVVLSNLRAARTRELSQTDWTQVADSPLSDSKKAEWATYRQALRDLPNTYTYDPNKVLIQEYFPTKPS